MESTIPASKKRLVSVDQLRGYAIFGMLLVNAKGLFNIKFEQISHHQEFFTYADTIAPLFMFVVGIGMRLSWLRRSEQVGMAAARKSLFKRFGIIVLIAFVIYAGYLWDALMDIGLAGMSAVMLIDKKPRTRILAAFFMVAVYQALCMFTFYGPWIMREMKLGDENTPLLIKLIPLHGELFDVALNGGPFGPLSWCMMLLFGTVAYDWMASGNERKLVSACLGWGLGLCAAGYLLSMEWPGVKALWPISAYYMTAPFPLWASGLCFLQLLIFYLLCDKLHVQIPTFSDLGMNPLFFYIVQSLVLGVAEAFETPEPPFILGVCGFALFYALFAGAAYYMRRKNILIKI